MAVDDTGRGGQQGGNATQRRFEPLRLSRREPLQIIDAVRPGRVGNALDTRDLTFFSSYDQVANLCVRDPMLAAIRVKGLAPGDTAARLQAAGRIIKPTMNDLAAFIASQIVIIIIVGGFVFSDDMARWVRQRYQQIQSRFEDFAEGALTKPDSELTEDQKTFGKYKQEI
jgi:hypothetical protein